MNRYINILRSWNININDEQLRLFDRYYELLVSWNKKVNLTAITDREDVYIKHFADSLAVTASLDMSGKYILDVGSGAGFPGVPIGIMHPDCNVVLLDSLNKRINFLNELIDDLELSNVTAVHGRAEDLAHDSEYRERFDLVLSRAVANLRVLSEYCLPFTVKKGYFISYKSGNIDDEISDSEHAVMTLGGSVEKIDRFTIPDTDYERSLVYIIKDSETDNRYPRKAGVPAKKPL